MRGILRWCTWRLRTPPPSLSFPHAVRISPWEPATGFPTARTGTRLARFYAAIYGAYVVFVNRTGSERGLDFYGESSLINPFGEMVTHARGRQEGVFSGTINLNQVRKARTMLHTVRDDNLDFIQRNLDRVRSTRDIL